MPLKYDPKTKVTDRQRDTIDNIIKRAATRGKELEHFRGRLDTKYRAHIFINTYIIWQLSDPDKAFRNYDHQDITDDQESIIDDMMEALSGDYVHIEDEASNLTSRGEAYYFIDDNICLYLNYLDKKETSKPICTMCKKGKPEYYDTFTGKIETEVTICSSCYDKKCEQEQGVAKPEILNPSVVTDISEPPIGTSKTYYCINHSDRKAEFVCDRSHVGHDSYCTECASDYYGKTKQTKSAETTAVNNKEENKMMANLKSLLGDFGKDTSGNFKLSFQGLAVRDSKNNFLVYDGEDVTNVMDFVVDSNDLIFKMPVTIDQINPGDVIIDDGRALFVVKAGKKRIRAIDPITKNEVDHVAVKNMFGFQFYTKVTSILNMGGTPDGGAPFNPLMFLAMGEGESDLGNLLPLMMMSQQQGGAINQMLPMLLLSKEGGGNDKMMQMMMMSQMTGGQNPFANMFGAPSVKKEKKKKKKEKQEPLRTGKGGAIIGNDVSLKKQSASADEPDMPNF